MELGIGEIADAARVIEVEVGCDDVADIRGVVAERLDLADR